MIGSHTSKAGFLAALRLLGITAIAAPLSVAAPAFAQVDVSAQMASARKAFADGKNDEALKFFNEVIKLRPDYITAYLERGRAFYALNRLPEAAKDFAEVTKQKPMVASGWFNLGFVQMSLKTPDYAGAIASFSKVIELNPKPRDGENLVADALDKRALCYLEQKNFGAAITDLGKLLEANPKNANGLLNRAYAYTSLNPPQNEKAAADYNAALALVTKPDDKAGIYLVLAEMEIADKKLAQATAHLDQALQLQPGNVAAYLVRGNLNFQQEKFPAAEADYTQVIMKGANTESAPEAYRNRGATYLKLKQYDKAVADYTAFLQKVPNPNPPDVFKFRAAAYLSMTPRNLAASIADYEKYVAVKTNDAVAWRDLTIAYHDSGAPSAGETTLPTAKTANLEKAIAAADKAIALDAKQADPYLFKGKALFYLRRFEPSVTAYSKFIELSPTEIEGYNSRGRAYFNLSRWSEAVADFDKYLAKKADDADARRLRVLAYDRANAGASPAEKIAEYEKAIVANPNDPLLYSNLGAAYFKMENFDKAAQSFQKAITLSQGGSIEDLNNLALTLRRKAEKSKSDADFTAAIAAYGKVLEKSPGNGPALLDRGAMFMAQKKWKEAAAEFSKFLTANPTATEATLVYNDRASAYLQMDPPDYKGAIADYSQVIQKEPTNPVPYKIRGLAYKDQKDYANSINDLNKYLEMSAGKPDPEILQIRAETYFTLGDVKRKANDPSKGTPEFDKAIADYTAYLGLKANDPNALFARGLAMYRKSNATSIPELTKAMADFEAAAAAKSDLARAVFYIGLSADNYGTQSEPDRDRMFQKAIDAYTKFISMPGADAPSVDLAKKRITILKEALG